MIQFSFLNLDTLYTYDFRCAICLCVEMCKPPVDCFIVHPTPIYRAQKKHAKCQLTGTPCRERVYNFSIFQIPYLPTKKNFAAGHTVVFCRTPNKICGTCFEENIHAQKAPAHVVSTCACAPCKGTISFPDSSFQDVSFDCLPTYVFSRLVARY